MQGRLKIVAILVALIAVLPFVGAWQFSAIGIDDPHYYLLEPNVTNGLSFAGLKWAFTDLSNAIWMPLTWLVYQADYSLRNLIVSVVDVGDGFSLAYSIAHLQSVLLHGLNAALLFGLLRLIGGRRATLLPAVAALLWAVHPLRVESVVWIASLKDVLSLTFLLVALLFWVRSRQGGGRRDFVLSHVFFVLACCAKPSAITFPGMVFLLDALLGRMLPLSLAWRRYGDYLPSLVLAVPLAVLAQIAQTVGGATSYLADVPLWYRLLNALVSIGVYARNLVWPSQLAPQCALQWPQPPHFAWAGGLLGAATVALAAVLAIRAFVRIQRQQAAGAPFATVGLLWALGTLLPMLGISAFGGHAFADRFTYLPAIGVSIALLGIDRARGGWRRPSATVAVAALAVALACVAQAQTRHWRNDGTLMPRILEVDGDGNFLAHVCLAKHLYERDHSPAAVAAAERHFTRGYALNPAWCMSSSLTYMFILGECGKAGELPKVQRAFIDWLRNVHHQWNSLDQDISEGIVELYGDGSSGPRIESARRTADALLSSGRRDVPQIFYLAYLVGQAADDRELTVRGLEGLRTISDFRTGYDNPYRFRFALSEKGEEK